MSEGYSLLVVDDEKKAREHVLNDIAWDTLGINKLYQASDGLDALEKVRLHKPDIIILDIKMPGMNGVEFLEQVYKQKIDIQIIALSGYSDFEAARKMLTTGLVVEYLLKPASEDVMFEAVLKCIENIDKKNRVMHLQKDLTQAQALLRRTMLQNRLFENVQDDETDQESLLSAERFIQVAVISCKNHKALKGLVDAYAKQGSCLELCLQCPNSNKRTLLFTGNSKKDLNQVQEICMHIAAETDGYIGIGRPYQSEYNLNISFQEAMLAYASRIFMEGARLRYIDDVESQISMEINEMVSKEQLALILKQGSDLELENAINNILKTLIHQSRKLASKSSGKQDLDLIRIYFANFADAMLKESKEELSIAAILAAGDIDELMVMVKNTFMQYKNSRQQDALGHKAAIVSEVKDYINNNYQDHITLESAAQLVYINPTYLSKLFSEIEKCGFSDYIAKVRIEQAKKLLAEKNRRHKVYEIAEKVGYRNVKHFMRVFKKLEGITPSEYRELVYTDAI